LYWVYKHSPVNINSTVKVKGSKFKSKVNKSDLSNSRNKLLKNKTLPNLMNYTMKAASLMKGSTKFGTKRFQKGNS
jgi:hypothetical protein